MGIRKLGKKRASPAASLSTTGYRGYTPRRRMEMKTSDVPLRKRPTPPHPNVEVPPYKDQQEFVKKHLRSQLRKGQEWYLLDVRWFKQWKKYVAFDVGDTDGAGKSSSHPGPIDSSSLYESNSTTLRSCLIDEVDYMLVPEPVWNKLQAWYGLADGSQPICRRVVEFGMFTKHCKVEVYLMEFQLAKLGDKTDGQKTGQKTVTRSFSRSDTIGRLTQVMKDVFDIPEEAECRLWNRCVSTSLELLKNDEESLQEAGLYSGQTILIELKGADGVWPRGEKTPDYFSSNYSSSSSSGYSSTSGSSSTGYSSGSKTTSSSSSYGSCTRGGTYGSTSTTSSSSSGFLSGWWGSSASKLSEPGLSGLSNLGNTCFMNSALQCMSNTRVLTSYFLEQHHMQELNRDNPLGMKGKIAMSYGKLLDEIWNGRSSVVSPRDFKRFIEQFAPQFSGSAPQDSHELLAFLLDSLHEDLNRIKKKPYAKLKDSDGRPDHVVAKEAWENHRKRNDSVIVDLFQGQFKSRFVCPECQNVSLTFDSFMYLSLPLPVTAKSRQIEIFLVRQDPNSTPMVYNVMVPKLGCVGDLKRKLGSMSGISPDYLVVTDVYNHRFHKLFMDSEGLTTIQDRDTIYVYEVSVTEADDPNTVVLPVYHRQLRNSYYYRSPSLILFGLPFLLCVPRKKTTYRSLYNALTAQLVRLLKNNASETQDTHGTEQEDTATSRSLPDLFKISSVNSYGSTSTDVLAEDGKPLKLTNRTYLALDWPEEGKCAYMESVSEQHDKHDSCQISAAPQKKVFNLYDCLKLFTTEEQLGEDDPWYCPKCKKHQQAMKKFDLWKLPEVLVVHLKRFHHNCDKLDTLINFPLTGFDLTEASLNKDDEKAVYDLHAISNHFDGLDGGHNTTYAKNANDGKWYNFDDSSVSLAADRELVSKSAYILFYTRRKTAVSLDHKD